MLDAGSDGGHELEEDHEILVDADGVVVLLVLIVQNLPLAIAILAGSRLAGIGLVDVKGGSLIDEALHAGTEALLTVLDLGEAKLESGVGAVKQDLHDAGVAAGVNAGGLDRRRSEDKVLEGDGLVLVVANNVLHHGHRREGLVGDGVVAREVEARGAVVGRVSDVEGVGAQAAMKVSKLRASIQVGKK